MKFNETVSGKLASAVTKDSLIFDHPFPLCDYNCVLLCANFSSFLLYDVKLAAFCKSCVVIYLFGRWRTKSETDYQPP